MFDRFDDSGCDDAHRQHEKDGLHRLTLYDRGEKFATEDRSDRNPTQWNLFA